METTASDFREGLRPPALLPIDPLCITDRLLDARERFRHILQDGYHEIILDMTGVRVVSSELISFLLVCGMDCSRCGVHLVVANVHGDLLKPLRFAGLNQVLDIRTQQ